MDLLKLLNATGQQDQLIGKLATQFGLDSAQTGNAVNSIMGALSGGVQNKAQQGGLQDLMGVLQQGNLEQYVDQPDQLSSSKDDGNALLGQLLGSKDASRAVASNVEQQSGVSSDIVKQMLPMVATMAMGAMKKNASSQGGDSQLSSMLTSLLDQDKDGNVLDDVMGLFGKR